MAVINVIAIFDDKFGGEKGANVIGRVSGRWLLKSKMPYFMSF